MCLVFFLSFSFFRLKWCLQARFQLGNPLLLLLLLLVLLFETSPVFGQLFFFPLCLCFAPHPSRSRAHNKRTPSCTKMCGSISAWGCAFHSLVEQGEHSRSKQKRNKKQKDKGGE